MKPLLLFDIDGTLLRAHGAGERAMARAGRLVMGESYSLESVTFSGGLDPSIFYEGAEQSGLRATEADHARFRDAYLSLLPSQLELERDTVVALPGVHALLDELRQDDELEIGLLTGNYSEGAQLKLRHVGIEPNWFRIGAFGDLAPSRPELVPVALAQYERLHRARPPTESVVIIGDTPRDVHCARVNGCQVLAVATGKYDADALRAAGARHVAEDLTCSGALQEVLAVARGGGG